MTLRGSDQPLHLAHDVALIDLDGVCYRGDDPVEHAAESLTAAREGGLAARFVTNNASREPGTVADHLTELGIATEPDEVVTAAQAGAALLAERFPEGSPILVVGGAGLRTAVAERGMRIVEAADDEPVAVIQGWDPNLSWGPLAEACYAIERGAAHIATNLDFSIPKPGGIAPGNGAFVDVVARVSGSQPISTGKPEPEIFETAARRAGGTAPIILGDRLDTDIRGAVSAGMASLHVLTGVDDARNVVLADPIERPTYLAIDLRDLLVAHPEVTGSTAGGSDGADTAGTDSATAASTVWTAGSAHAHVADGVLHLDDGTGTATPLGTPAGSAPPAPVTVSLDGYRALAAAAWASADAGAPLDPQVVPELVVERR
ncbi:HAD-IIA family hydrolase [Georgenia sp. Z1344]|uniref:HAD-IIA family hydrolase n=1 Tax=Georgenia sp. Z1344 TaxID=3416706 RepID=UPI003CEA6F5A